VSELIFTDEQAAIISFEGKRLVVKAFAGTGKTFTMLHFTLARPTLRFLYLAFNRSVRDEAALKFPSNVTCLTYNQLCYQHSGRQYRQKLAPSLRVADVAEILMLRNLIEARDVIATLDAFCNSNDDVLDLTHFRSQAKRPSQSYMRNTLANALAYWAQMIDPENPTPIHHNGYTKVFELSRPDLSNDYDGILYDEGQDCPPSTVKVLAMQDNLQLIIIGDSAQSIYGFREAVNSLSSPELEDAPCLTLSESFRFGPEVAAVANAFLLLRGEQRRVRGLGSQGVVLKPDQFKWSQHRGQVCVLARTVATVLGVALYFSAKGKSVGFVGGFDSYGFDAIEQVFHLHRRDLSKLKGTRLLRDYPTFQQYETFAEDAQDNEMLRTCRIIQDYPFLPTQLAQLRQQLFALEQCDIVVGTAHKSKGLEFPTVYLASDFPDLFDPDSPYTDAELEQEINLMYVAVTRARDKLILNETAMDAIKRVAKYQVDNPKSIPVAS
tara:strand:- start:6610 stop:8091 length:1482 start_codon:yes stop_codon:yes gene_type:complete